jgi:hypothetical protein
LMNWNRTESIHSYEHGKVSLGFTQDEKMLTKSATVSFKNTRLREVSLQSCCCQDNLTFDRHVYTEKRVPHEPKNMLDDSPLSAVSDCLFNTVAATVQYLQAVSSICNLSVRCGVTMGPINVGDVLYSHDVECEDCVCTSAMLRHVVS